MELPSVLYRMVASRLVYRKLLSLSAIQELGLWGPF